MRGFITRTFWLANLKGRDYAEDLGVDGKVILEWTVGKLGEGTR